MRVRTRQHDADGTKNEVFGVRNQNARERACVRACSLFAAMPATMRGTPSATKILAYPTTTPPKTTTRRDPFHLDDPQVSAPPKASCC